MDTQRENVTFRIDKNRIQKLRVLSVVSRVRQGVLIEQALDLLFKDTGETIRQLAEP